MPILTHLVRVLKADFVSKPVSLSVIKVVSGLFAEERDGMECDGNHPRTACLNSILPALVQFFTATVAKKSARGLDKEILRLLVLISVDIDSPALSGQLSRLILHQLKSKSIFLRIDLLSSLARLLTSCSADELGPISRDLILLCGTIGSDLNIREKLVECFSSLATLDDSYSKLHRVVADFNATRKHLHYPIDFEKRLDSINAISNSKPFDFGDLCFWRCVMVNAFFLYQNVDDLSIQTASSRLIVSVMKEIPHNSEPYRVLVSQIILVQIRKMLKSRKEKIRFEFVQLLSQVVTHFDDREFCDLKCLKDDDVELDFFENVTHLQTHRRQRALKRAAKAIEERKIRPQTAERFAAIDFNHIEAMVSFLFKYKNDFRLEIKCTQKTVPMASVDFGKRRLSIAWV